MHYHTQANPAGGLPVPYDRWDANTVNPNLPYGNDVWPSIQVPPNLSPQTVEQVVVGFRQAAQNRLGASPLHNFLYNLFSQQYFNNQFYLEWVQRAVDFAEFLQVAQNNPPPEAVRKAVQKIYNAALAVTAGQYPALANMISPDLYQGLLRAGDEFKAIMQDLQAFHMAGRRPAMGVGGGYPHPQTNVYGQPTRHLPPVHAAPSAYPTASYPVSPVVPTTSVPASYSRDGGRYDVPPPQSQPMETWSSTSMNNNNPYPTQPDATPSAPVATGSALNLPIPTSLDDIVIDPDYFVPVGFSPDPERPYDVIHNPGDVEIRPAHLSGWKRTRGDHSTYPLAYDPTRYVLFHVKWPDGVVMEKLVEWTTEMEYLKHEIDDQLRALKIRPTGKVVASTHKITDFDRPPVSVEEAKLSLDDGLDVDALAPVVLPGYFSAGSDLDNEQEARRQLISQLGLPEDTKVLPAHEYQSIRTFPIDVTPEVESYLLELADVKSLARLADELESMLADGSLPVRYYRFFNERLTAGINQALAENLSLEGVKIQDFVEDITDLYDHLRNHYDPAMPDVFHSQTKGFLKRWFDLGYETDPDTGESRFCLLETAINLQTSWRSEELTSLNARESAALLSTVTHPKVMKVVRECLTRNSKEDTLAGRRVRLITVDGVYLEILRGWLQEGALLIRQR